MLTKMSVQLMSQLAVISRLGVDPRLSWLCALWLHMNELGSFYLKVCKSFMVTGLVRNSELPIQPTTTSPPPTHTYTININKKKWKTSIFAKFISLKTYL